MQDITKLSVSELPYALLSCGKNKILIGDTQSGSKTVLHNLLDYDTSSTEYFLWQGKGDTAIHPRVENSPYFSLNKSTEFRVDFNALTYVWEIYQDRLHHQDIMVDEPCPVVFVISDWQTTLNLLKTISKALFNEVIDKLVKIAITGSAFGITLLIESKSAKIDDLGLDLGSDLGLCLGLGSGLGSYSILDNNFDLFGIVDTNEKCFDPDKEAFEIHNALAKVVNGNKNTFNIFSLVMQGCNYVSIAKNLKIPESTVCAATNALCKELGLRTSVHGGDMRSIQDYLLKLSDAIKKAKTKIF